MVSLLDTEAVSMIPLCPHTTVHSPYDSCGAILKNCLAQNSPMASFPSELISQPLLLTHLLIVGHTDFLGIFGNANHTPVQGLCTCCSLSMASLSPPHFIQLTSTITSSDRPSLTTHKTNKEKLSSTFYIFLSYFTFLHSTHLQLCMIVITEQLNLIIHLPPCPTRMQAPWGQGHCPLILHCISRT